MVDARQRTAALWRWLTGLVDSALGHNLPQLSASLTYFTVLSLFPALIVVVGLLGAVGLSQEALLEILNEVGERTRSQWAVDLVSSVLDSIFATPSGSAFLGIGLLASLWTASSYIRSFMWASEQIYEVSTSRSYFRGLPVRLGLGLLLIVMFTTAVAAMALLGPLGSRLADLLGLESGELPLWSRLALLLLLVVTLFMLAVLFKYAPSRRQPPLWHLLAGAAVTVIAWIVASAGFSFYLANFGSYNVVYGTLGAAVAFLVWAWILNIAVLVGVEVNRSLEKPPRDGADVRGPAQGSDQDEGESAEPR